MKEKIGLDFVGKESNKEGTRGEVDGGVVVDGGPERPLDIVGFGIFW